MTRGKLVSFVVDDLGVVIDGKKHLARLLPKMRENGLIIADKSTYFITEKGKDAIPEEAKVGLSRIVSLICVSFGFCAIGTK